MESNRISLNTFSIVLVLGTVAFLLVCISIAGQLTVYMTGCCENYRLVMLFNVGGEHNIPTFFSSFLLIFAGVLLAIITLLERNRKASGVLYWAILSFGFLFMAVDEFFSFHERLTEPMQRLLGGGNLGLFHFAWVIPGIALVLIPSHCFS